MKRHLHHRTHGIFSSTAGGQRQQRWYSLNSDPPPSLLRITHALHAFHKVKAERRADLSVKNFTVPFQLRPNCFVIVLPIFTTESTICRPKKQEALQTVRKPARLQAPGLCTPKDARLVPGPKAAITSQGSHACSV